MVGHAAKTSPPMFWWMLEGSGDNDADCADDRFVYVAHTWVEARDLARCHLGVPSLGNKIEWASSDQKPRGPVRVVHVVGSGFSVEPHVLVENMDENENKK